MRSLGVLSSAEREQILERLERHGHEPPAPTTLPSLFEAQVARTTGCRGAGARRCAIDLRELDASANRLARHLVGRGVGPEKLVAVALRGRPK